MRDQQPPWRTAKGETAIRQVARTRPHPDGAVRRKRVIAGCLLAGAVGDALGPPVEFMSLTQTWRTYSPQGIRNYAPA